MARPEAPGSPRPYVRSGGFSRKGGILAPTVENRRRLGPQSKRGLGLAKPGKKGFFFFFFFFGGGGGGEPPGLVFFFFFPLGFFFFPPPHDLPLGAL